MIQGSAGAADKNGYSLSSPGLWSNECFLPRWAGADGKGRHVRAGAARPRRLERAERSEREGSAALVRSMKWRRRKEQGLGYVHT